MKHKDISAAIMEINTDTGRVQGVTPLVPEHMPFAGYGADLKKIAVWWDHRAIPQKRSDLADLLKEAGCGSPEEFMMKNLSLSLSDCYWICPEELPLSWKDVNLYSGAGNTVVFSGKKGSYSTNPDSTLGGNLEKRWVNQNGEWFLYKSGETIDEQQSVNEAFASYLHRKQGKENYVAYTLSFQEEGRCAACICRDFTSVDMEFIPAYEMVESGKKANDMSMYEFYIARCTAAGAAESSVRNDMEYQTLSDYLITNTDRHLGNFGILRNPDTLEVISCAPIFDSGNSMFYNAVYEQSYEELAATRVTSFVSDEAKMLSYVRIPDLIDLSCVPDVNETMEFYVENGISENKARLIAGNYGKKIEMLQDFQKGRTVSVYYGREKDLQKQQAEKRKSGG
ncbi:MAG: hypothetical protein Q4C60_05080 [Eubacteriales bacterium]|nr:hypothetical protein [Eubacteriales bacterium]